MAIIFNPSDLTTTRSSGVARATLADRSLLGVDALHVERIGLDARTATSPASPPSPAPPSSLDASHWEKGEGRPLGRGGG